MNHTYASTNQPTNNPYIRLVFISEINSTYYVRIVYQAAGDVDNVEEPKLFIVNEVNFNDFFEEDDKNQYDTEHVATTDHSTEATNKEE